MRKSITLTALIILSIAVPACVLGNPTGTAIWRSGTSTIPLHNPWNGTSFDATDSTLDVADFRILAGAESPLRDEKFIVGVDESNDISMVIWNGSTWPAVPWNPLANVAESFWWGCDVAYMQQDGDALVVWNNGSTGTDCVSYGIGNTYMWSGEYTTTAPITGEPKHMHLAANPLSDEMVLVVSNEDSKDYAIVWDGSSWGNAEVLDNSGAGDDRTDICVAYEQQSGHALVTYGWGLPAVYYSIWDGSAWSSPAGLAKPADASGNVRWTTLAADPNSNRIALGVLTRDQDIWICVWDDSTWETPVTATNSATGQIYPGVAVAFEGLTGTGMATYGEGTQVRYRTWISGSSWSGDLQVANIGSTPTSQVLDAAPNSDHIMLSVLDGTRGLNYIHWDGDAWGLPDELESDTDEDKNQPFLFLWDIEPITPPPMNYYVAPDGNDGNDGLTPGTAWHSLDNGDQLGVLAPGDTINIESGTYIYTRTMTLTTSGTASDPVVYTKRGAGFPKIRTTDGTFFAISLEASYAVLCSLDISVDQLSGLNGIQISGDYCTIQGCRLRDLPAKGLHVIGDSNLILRNVIANSVLQGVLNPNNAEYNEYYGNTIYGSGAEGIKVQTPVATARIFNNILVANDVGIDAKAGNVCAYNDVWNNTSYEYRNGAADSSGGISADPRFVNPVGDNFHLRQGSPCMNAGLDLGYPYNDSAPEMGACEYVPHTPVNYYVSPVGDDDDDGLAPGSAWLSLDNGDTEGYLFPGDTVNVEAGTYYPSNTYSLTTYGTSSSKVTYRGYGGGWPVFDGAGQDMTLIGVEADHVIVESLRPYNNHSSLSGSGGIVVDGDSCEIAHCYVDSCARDGIRIEGDHNLLLRNLVIDTDNTGVFTDSNAAYNLIHGNTIFNAGSSGIVLFDSGTARAFNNIVVQNGLNGIQGDAAHIIAFNDVWENLGLDYIGGAADSAGGISADPLFLDPAAGDFALGSGSPAIDAGLDLGYPYSGSAPDMGALEYSGPRVYYVSESGDDDNDGLSPASAWLSIDNGNQKGILVPGDSVKIASGTYSITQTVLLNTSGTALAPITYTGYGPGDVVVDLNNASQPGILILGSHVEIHSITVTNADEDGIRVDGDSCTVAYCKAIGVTMCGIKVRGSSNLFLKNIVYSVGNHGIRNTSDLGGANNRYFGNTIHQCGGRGIQLVVTVETARLFNNIVTDNDASGIDGPAANVCGFNDVWGNQGGGYTNGVSDSAGGISADPMFVNPAADSFQLQCGSPAIDAGLDLGYGFNGDAPDMGALESSCSDSIAFIVVEPETVTVVEGGTQAFTAGGYCSDSTFVADLTDSVTWSTDDPSGDVDSTGLYTAGNDISPPDYSVVAVHNSMSDSAAVTVVTSGGLSYIRIELVDGTPFPDTTLTTDNDSTNFYCRGYDSGDNLLGNYSANWNLIGDAIGVESPSGGISTTLELRTPGMARMVAVQGGGLTDTTGVITCLGGEPVELVISPDVATVSADSTLQFTVTAFDDDGNPTGPIVSPTWDVLGGIGTIDAAGLFTAKTVGTGQITVTSGALSDVTGDIEVIAGSVAWIDIDPDSVTLLEGATQQYTATGYDADSNFVADVTDSTTWEATDPSGSIDSTGFYTAGHDLSPPDYEVVGTFAGAGDTAAVTVIMDSTLAYIRVELNDGTPFPDTTLTTDNDTTELYCRGYNPGGNPLGDHAVTWVVIGVDSIGTVAPDTGTSTKLALSRVGTGQVAAEFDASIKDTSGVITAISGEPVTLVISPDTATVSTDSTVQFDAVSLDADGNETSPQVAPVWEVLGDIGTIDGVGLFTPTTTGIGNVAATGGELTDTTGTITVIAGALDSLFISPNSDTISADSTRQFTATGFDCRGNPVSDLGNLTWTVQGGIGTIDSGGLFDAVLAGTGFIKVTSDLGPYAVTDSITVIPGEVAYIDVIPDENLVIEETPYQFDALAYDSDSNYVYDATDIAVWTTTDPSGSVSATGLYTSGHDPSPPTYYVKAVHNAFADSSEITVLAGGVLKYVRIEWNDGSPVTDTTLTTDVDNSRFYCRGYNSADSLLGDVSVIWSLLGGDSIGFVSPGPAIYTTLVLSQPGIGRLVAAYSAEVADTSGIIMCVAGVPASLVISPDTATVIAGNSTQFTTTTFDADGNPSDPVVITSWEVLGGIGSISPTGLFTGETAGTGAITCQGEGLADTTGSITVIAGQLAEIEISPDSADVAVGSSVGFGAEGFDTYGNATETGNLTWGVLGEIGTISPTGVFTALNVGTGRIAVTSSIGGVADTNSIVRVLASDLMMLVVTPDTATVKIASGVQFAALGFNPAYVPADVGILTWEVLGGIGTIDSEGAFTATTPGAGKVAATSNINGISDTTNMIVVEVPTVAELPLGNSFVRANQTRVPILALRIANAFDGAEALEGITVRDASRGAGSGQQVRSNIASLAMFVDSDRNSVLSPADSKIAETTSISATTSLSFSPVTIAPGSNLTFFVAVDIQTLPHDADSIDMFMLSATDIELSGGTPVAGPGTLNSMGCAIIDGLVAEQLTVVSAGNETASPGDEFVRALTVDIPRNGYSSDQLEILSVFNAEDADTFDIDSLMFYLDDGNGIWDGNDDEIRVGPLSFTGEHWEISGLHQSLVAPVTRFHVGVMLKADARNGTNLALGIPLHGLEMASENDGPIDRPVDPVDTVSILSAEVVTVRVVALSGHDVIPGQATGPILALELTSSYDLDVSLECLDLEFVGVDPGGASQDDLDSQIGGVRLWLDRDANHALQTTADSVIATTLIADGVAHFEIPDLLLPDAGSMVLFIDCDIARYTSKDGNTVGFAVLDEDGMCFDRSVNVAGTFPLDNPGEFRIEIFPAATAVIHPVDGATLYGGQSNCLVLDFELPRNGYAEDRLSSLLLSNRGQAGAVQALDAIRLWADSDGNGFSTGDMLLGDFELVQGSWEISGLSLPLTGETNRLFITVDVTNDDFDGGTLQFEIPVKGAKYASGADGPDDQGLNNPMPHFLFPANRITVIPIPKEPGTVYPGAENAQVLTFALYNGYVGQVRELDAVRLTNRSRTVSTPEFADHQLGQVSLYFDQDASRAFDNDSLLAAGYFSDSRLNLTGLNIEIEPESLFYFFVVSDLPLDAIDSDTLAVTVEEHSDFTFGQTVNINGYLPVSRGGDLVVDGSVSAQYGLLPLSSRSLSPGDQRVTLLALRPALNGDRIDLMQSLVVGNSGDADTSEFDLLELWIDQDDDRSWSVSDTYVGELDYINSSWHIGGINLEVAYPAPVLLVTGNVTARASPNAEFRGLIPIGGCGYASANDGPVDTALEADHIFVISSSGLRVAYGSLKPEYSVGQNLSLRVYVTNLLGISIEDVSCDLNLAGDPGALHLESSSAGPVTLDPGEIAEFTYDYTAVEHGTVYWQMRAYSTVASESSAVVTTEPVFIQAVPTGVNLRLLSSIPTAVTRGQAHVFPLSLRFKHGDMSAIAAPVRLDSLRVRVEDGSTQPQAADAVFSRMVLASGYTNLAIVESFGTESSVLLAFSEPAVVDPGEDIVLSLRVDIDSLATAESFALSIESQNSIRFVDDNTSQPVPIDPPVAFPLRTAACAINDPSQHMAVSYKPVLASYVNYGQEGVGILDLVLRHGGGVSNSQIQFTAITFEFVDDSGAPIIAADLVDRIRLIGDQGMVGELHTFGPGSSEVEMVLTAPPVLSPGQTDTIRIQASIRDESPRTSFGLAIADSTVLTLRDLSSGGVVIAISDPMAALGGPVFPMLSGVAQLRCPAAPPTVCLTPRVPSAVIAGSDAVALVNLDIGYASGFACSPVCLENMQMSVLDTLGRALDTYQLFDRIGFRVGDNPITYKSSIELREGYTVFDLGPEGVIVQPGDEVSVELVADIEADTPFDHFVIRMNGNTGITLSDATEANRNPGYTEDEGCEVTLPFTTGLTRILLPAGSPIVKPSPMSPRLGCPGQRDIMIFEAELAYKPTTPKGDLVMLEWRGTTVERMSDGLHQVPAREVFDAVYLLSEGQIVAMDTLLAGDEIVLEPVGEFVLARGSSRVFEIACDIASDANLGNFVIEFADSAFLDLRDRELLTGIHPVLTGQDYPVQTAEIAIEAGGLSNSFVNWPNPFNPAGETTTIGFVLGEDAHVDIEIFTITGELVKKVCTNSFRSAGPHDQQDTWDGSDNSGHSVQPGTYFCRITARYGSGRTEDARRKVAVTR